MREDEFLGNLFPTLGAMPEEVVIPPGDDCAALRTASGDLLLIAVDQLVAGRHYYAEGPRAPSPEAETPNPMLIHGDVVPSAGDVALLTRRHPPQYRGMIRFDPSL